MTKDLTILTVGKRAGLFGQITSQVRQLWSRSRFAGMVTDSRSFMSHPRHDDARQLLALGGGALLSRLRVQSEHR
ncbi:MAG: glucuronate isomerase [Verrucomicrobia bacterium]|nr:glucuronate isomerase [Verrucomicrobiota bacterium]